LTACKSGGRRTQTEENALSGPPYYISLETPLKNRAPVNLSEIGGLITYIPLETSQNTLVGRVSKTIVTDSLIFISTIPYKLMAFDYSGRFVRNYGNVGRGPGEFIQINDFAVSPYRSSVYVLSNGGRILEYDTTNGKFATSAQIENRPMELMPFNDSLFAFVHPFSPIVADTSTISLFLGDLHGNMGKTYHYYNKFDGIFGLFFKVLYKSKNQVRFFELIADTLYTITPNALIPYADFDLGDQKLPAAFFSTRHLSSQADNQRLYESYSGKYYLDYIREDLKSIYFRGGNFNEEEVYGFFNKQTGAVKITEMGGFTNDLDGGVPFFPKYVYNDEVLVDYVDAYVLKEHVATLDPAEMTRLYGDNYTRLDTLAESLEEDSNPVMIMVSK
jgi:hypothetical protein